MSSLSQSTDKDKRASGYGGFAAFVSERRYSIISHYGVERNKTNVGQRDMSEIRESQRIRQIRKANEIICNK
uniref:Uncharacterized protein n=1 Tax=Heterorhabditis bacteriophora TaxID=37862 RepID=A0A1I7WWB5_HETBA